jgi:hypothetical protein
MNLPDEPTEFLDDPEQARWLHHGMCVAEGFCLDHLPERYLEDDQEHVVGILATVASYLWGSSDGLPSWGSLDVAGLVAFVGICEPPRPIDDAFFDTIITFYDYLAALELVPVPVTERIQRDLFLASHAITPAPTERVLQ